jgi:hypothetical protein
VSAGLAAIRMTAGPLGSYWWRPGYLAPLTVLGAVAVVVIALAARRLLGLQGGLIRTLLCAVLGLVPLLRRLPRRFDRISAAVERGQLSASIRLLADPRDQDVLSGYLHQALACVLAATTGIMAAILLASQGGPLISQNVRLYAVFGYNLLVISAVLAIRVLSAQARWRRDPKDDPGWRADH